MRRLVVMTAAALVGSTAHADPATTLASVDSGSFLLLSPVSKTDQTRALMTGTYDFIDHAPELAGSADIVLAGPLSLSLGASSTGLAATGRAALQVGGSVGGVDLALAVGYEHPSWSEVPAITARLAAGRDLGGLYLLATAGLGLGTEQGERSGELDLAAVHRVAGDFDVGVDSQLHVDLERDTEEPMDESTWDLAAGPYASYTEGRVVVATCLAVAARRARSASSSDVGALFQVGIGVGF